MTATVRLGVALGAALLVGALAACGGGSSQGPPDIAYGRDVCTECHMIISEARYAAAYRLSDGKAYAFDDIADMVTHGTRAGVLADSRAWVHDYYSERWIDAPTAWYVESDLATPMGGGIVAFEAEADAHAFVAERGGQVRPWAELVAGLDRPTGTTAGTAGTLGG